MADKDNDLAEGIIYLNCIEVACPASTPRLMFTNDGLEKDGVWNDRLVSSVSKTQKELDLGGLDHISESFTDIPEFLDDIPEFLDDEMSCEDLKGNIEISRIWMRTFGTNDEIAAQGWKEFRLDAIQRYEEFERKLSNMESQIIHDNEGGEEVLDIEFMSMKKENINEIKTQMDGSNIEFGEVSNLFEQFSQFLPQGENRKKVNSLIGSLRKRYSDFILDLNRQKVILEWLIPRLQRFEFHGNYIKTWLDTMEPRCSEVLASLNNNANILQNEKIIDEIVDDIHVKKDIYDSYVEPGKGILGVDHQMNSEEVEKNIDETVPRWDSLCENIENCLNRIQTEKKSAVIAALENKSEMEKIDDKVCDQIENCTCFVPFKIMKVGDGKYTFGQSKTVRLLRIHGSSVVVRIGGGWEYLYDFLTKVDPCRAKQHITPQRVERISSRKMSVASLINNKESPTDCGMKPTRKLSAIDFHTSSRTVDSIHESGDESYTSPCVATSPSSPSPSPKVKLVRKDSCNRSTQNRKSARKPDLTNPENNPVHNPENNPLNNSITTKPENKQRRVSLVERQSSYAQNRQCK